MTRVQRFNAAPGVGAQRRGEQVVRVRRLLGRHAAAKGLAHAVAAVGQLVEEGRPHLLQGVGEAELEDRARDARVGRLRAEVGLLPALRLAR